MKNNICFGYGLSRTALSYWIDRMFEIMLCIINKPGGYTCPGLFFLDSIVI